MQLTCFSLLNICMAVKIIYTNVSWDGHQAVSSGQLAGLGLEEQMPGWSHKGPTTLPPPDKILLSHGRKFMGFFIQWQCPVGQSMIFGLNRVPTLIPCHSHRALVILQSHMFDCGNMDRSADLSDWYWVDGGRFQGREMFLVFFSNPPFPCFPSNDRPS